MLSRERCSASTPKESSTAAAIATALPLLSLMLSQAMESVTRAIYTAPTSISCFRPRRRRRRSSRCGSLPSRCPSWRWRLYRRSLHQAALRGIRRTLGAARIWPSGGRARRSWLRRRERGSASAVDDRYESDPGLPSQRAGGPSRRTRVRRLTDVDKRSACEMLSGDLTHCGPPRLRSMRRSR
jgi:hypothetical protein